MARKRGRRRGRKPKSGFGSWSLRKKIGLIVSGTLLTVAAAGIVLVASKLGKIETKKLDAKELEINQEVEHQTGYLNVALFGVDSRDAELGEGTRSDTIMIASLNRETKEVKICSVYRDTLLQQKDGSYNKANAAYSFGGVEDAVALLNKNLDLNIEHYVTVNFNALIDVIDALGGIELDLTQEEVFWTNGYCNETSRVTGRTFENITQPGKQVLDGVQATSYCRIRYTDGDDYRRTERQRAVLEQIVTKAQKANLGAINKIVDDVFKEIGTNFTLTEMLSYAKDAMKYKLGETNGFPFDKSTDTLSGVGSTVIPNTLESNVIKLHQFLFGDDGYAPSATVSEISIGVTKKAGDVSTEEEDTSDNYYNTGTNDGGGSGNTEYNNTGNSNSGGGTVETPSEPTPPPAPPSEPTQPDTPADGGGESGDTPGNGEQGGTKQ